MTCSNNSASWLASCGFLVNDPGSSSQECLCDGPDEVFLNAFVPICDLQHELGPTSIITEVMLMIFS